jgi:hypothetical protein
VFCLRNGSPNRDTITLLEHIAENDEEDRELRATATRIASGLKKKAATR